MSSSFAQTKTHHMLTQNLLQNISGKRVLFLFAITNAFYALMMAVTIPQLSSMTNGLPIFDILPMGYSWSQAQALLNALGNVGRSYYLTYQLPLDFFYPGLFAITYFLMYRYLLQKAGWTCSTLKLLAVLPLLAGCFDYLENLGIIYLLRSYPTVNETPVVISSLFSVVKSFSTTAFFCVLIITFLVYQFKIIASRRLSTT